MQTGPKRFEKSWTDSNFDWISAKLFRPVLVQNGLQTVWTTTVCKLPASLDTRWLPVVYGSRWTLGAANTHSERVTHGPTTALSRRRLLTVFFLIFQWWTLNLLRRSFEIGYFYIYGSCWIVWAFPCFWFHLIAVTFRLDQDKASLPNTDF